MPTAIQHCQLVLQVVNETGICTVNVSNDWELVNETDP